MTAEFNRDRIRVEEPEGFTQVPDSLLLCGDVSDGAYRLYAVLKHHARQGNSAYPGKRLLARELHVRSTRTVDARLAELKAAGYLKVTPRFHDLGGQTSNDYHLFFYPRPVVPPMDPAPDLPPQTQVREAEEPPVQNSAPPRGSLLPPARAAGCAEAMQPGASQISTSTPSTVPPKSAGGPRTGDPEGDRQRPGWGGRDQRQADVFAEAVISLLPAQLYPRTRAQFGQMLDLLLPLENHGTPAGVVDMLLAGRPLPVEVSHPVGLLRARIDAMPPPRRPRPRWCEQCDERTRHLYDESTDVARRCPTCHPLSTGSA